MKTKIRRLTQLSVIIGLLCHGAQAVTNNCNVTNVHYVEGNTLQVPCVEVGESLFNATFKILPNNLWELIQATPVSETRSGARSPFQNNVLKLPIVQLTDGSLWEALVQLTGQKSATGNLLFQLHGGKKLTATTDLGKVVFRIGNKTDVRRANANANSNANKDKDKDKDKDNGNAQNNTNNGNSGNGSSGNNGNQAPQNITAAVLKVDHIELTGSAKTDLKVSGEIDLLKVISGEPQLLGEVVLPANTHISQVRLILADGSYVIADGEKYPLEIPSGEQTDLKIHGDWGITGGQITSVQLDFNADDIRFNKAQGYRIKPTVKIANVELKELQLGDHGEIDLSSGTKPNEPFVLTVEDRLTVTLPNGIPPEVVDPEAEVVISRGEPTAEEAKTGGISSIYELSPDGMQVENGSITIRYEPTKIPTEYTEDNLTILQDGVNIPSSVNKEAKTVTAKINHFSCYTAVPVHSCNFSDIDYSDSKQEWMSTPVKELCKDGVFQGYKVNDSTWKYEPSKEATLLEVLKTLLSSSNLNCKRYIGKESVSEIIADAQFRLNLTISETDLEKPLSREKTVTYLANLHYGYFESNAISEMVSFGITNGERLTDNVTRAELARLAYLSRNKIATGNIAETCNATITTRRANKKVCDNQPTLVAPMPYRGYVPPYFFDITVPKNASPGNVRFTWKPCKQGVKAKYRFLLTRNKNYDGFVSAGQNSYCEPSTCYTYPNPKESVALSNTYIDISAFSKEATKYYWTVRDDITGKWTDWGVFLTGDGKTAGQPATLVYTTDAEGGPAKQRPDPRFPNNRNKDRFPTGSETYLNSGVYVGDTYTIDYCGLYPYPSKLGSSLWSESNIRWDSPVRLQSNTNVLEVKQLTENGHDYLTDWVPASSYNTGGWEKDVANSLLNAGKQAATWQINAFGHMSCYYKRKGASTKPSVGIEPEYIHTTPSLEKDDAAPLGQSHGCIHVRPSAIKEMIKKGYLIGGNKFIVHGYNEISPEKSVPKGTWSMKESGLHEYEVHFYPGETVIPNVNFGNGDISDEWIGNIYVIKKNP